MDKNKLFFDTFQLEKIKSEAALIKEIKDLELGR